MELFAFFRRVVAWRWTPCVAPVVGSVLIALLTLAVVPDEIQGMGGSGGPLALRAKRDKSSDTPAADPAADGAPGADGTAPAPHHGGLGRPRMPADAVQGFFHKPQELPVEPVDPNPQPPPPEPPPPAPTATVFTLPEPAAGVPPPPGLAAPPPPEAPGVEEPGTLPPPNVPLPPLGPGVQTERQ